MFCNAYDFLTCVRTTTYCAIQSHSSCNWFSPIHAWVPCGNTYASPKVYVQCPLVTWGNPLSHTESGHSCSCSYNTVCGLKTNHCYSTWLYSLYLCGTIYTYSSYACRWPRRIMLHHSSIVPSNATYINMVNSCWSPCKGLFYVYASTWDYVQYTYVEYILHYTGQGFKLRLPQWHPFCSFNFMLHWWLHV